MRRFAGRSCAASSLSMNGGDARQRRETERDRFGANSFGTEPPRSVLGICTARRAPPKAAARVLLRRPRRPDLAGSPLETRDWSEAEIGQAKRSPYHTSTADEHTLKGDRPAEREGKQGTMEAHSMQRARRGGVGSPKGNRWRNANARTNAAQGNAAEPSLGSRAAPRGNGNSAPKLG